MTTFTNNVLTFDPHDYAGMIKLMDRADEECFALPLFGKNVQGEDQLVSINSENITIETFQKNGFVRQNIYHRDYEQEELFEQ